MKATLKIKLGSNVLELQGEGSELVVMKALSFWTTLPSKCGKCASPQISMFARSAKKGTYYGLKCLDCSADLTFHQKLPENGGGFYLKAEDQWKVWSKDGEDEPKREAGDEIGF